MKKNKYTAVLLKREIVYVDNSTCQPIELTSEQKLMDGICGENKYTFCELFSKLGVVAANTYKALDQLVYNFCESNNNFDVEIFIIK